MYLARIRELCETTFTPERMGPAIQSMKVRLENEVRLRAQLHGWQPEAALQEFDRHIQSFQNQVERRRAFLLRELAKK